MIYTYIYILYQWSPHGLQYASAIHSIWYWTVCMISPLLDTILIPIWPLLCRWYNALLHSSGNYIGQYMLLDLPILTTWGSMLYKGLHNPSYLCIDDNPVLLWVLGIVRCLQLNDWWCHHLHLELISAAECQKTNHLLVDHSHPPICTSPSHKATCVYCWLYHSFSQRRMSNHVLLRCTWPWHANPFPSLVQCSWLLPTMELYDTHCSSPPPDYRPHPHWDPCMTSLH